MSTKQPEQAKPEHYQEDIEEEGRVVTADIGALTQLNAAEINQQIMTARAYPRSVVSFRRSMFEMVTYDQATALSCLYALQRGGKVIEGPSIRFAEAAVQAWGNTRAGSRIVDIGEEFITAQGFFYDLERNMAVTIEVLRRITDSKGNRFGDDMIGVTGNAAGSLALRNAILRGIPKVAWNESYQAARQLSIGKGESISTKRLDMLKAFAPLGIPKELIFALLGVKGADDVTVDQLIFMNGILNSLKEGETTAEIVFAPENLKGAVMTPPRPKESEFKREESGKPPAQEKPAEADKPVDKPADKPQETAADSSAERERRLREDMAEFLKQKLQELPTIAKVRDIGPFREDLREELEGYPELIKDMDAACDKRRDEITEKSKRR